MNINLANGLPMAQFHSIKVLDLPLQDHMIDVPPVPNIIEMAKIQNA
jgi:hypothetical protein